MSDHLHPDSLDRNNYCSPRVSVEPDAGYHSGPDDPRQVSFRCPGTRGAVLSLPVAARREDTLAQGDFRQWIVKNIDNWFAFARELGLGIQQMEEIILVTGCDLTRSWTNIAFLRGQVDAQVSFGVKVEGPDISINFQFSPENAQGAVLRQGPEGTNLPENQCVFVRGFRVARTFWKLPRRLKAAGGPFAHPGGYDPDTEVISIPASTEYRDPLHILLDYIAEQASDCDMVLAHDNTLAMIAGLGHNTSLENLEPDVMADLLRKSNIEIQKDSYDVSPTNSGLNSGKPIVKVAMLSMTSQNWNTHAHGTCTDFESKALSDSNYQHVFSVALESYKNITGIDLTSNPLLSRLETCNSPDAVIALLREQIRGFDQSRNDNDSERLSNWLNPTVNVISAFSGTISEPVGMPITPAGLIFTGIAVLLSAATAVSNRRDTLTIIFERIENVFRRLETYIKYPRTAAMIDAIVKAMIEVLCIIAIETKEIKENRAKTYLVGEEVIEDALLRLENAILEETRMAAAEALKRIHVLQGIVEDRMRGVEGMLEGVGDMLQDFDEKMEDISQKGINNVENAASHTVNDVGTAPVIGLATVSGAEEGIKMEIDDDKVHGVQDTAEGVRDGTKNVDNEQGVIEDIGARVIDGGEKIIRPIASNWAALSPCIDGYIAQMFGPQVAQEYHALLRREPGQIQFQVNVAGTDAFLATPPSGPTSGQHSWVMDYAVINRGPVIRQKIWVPKKSSDKRRWVDHEQLHPPIFFIHKNGQDLGLPLKDAAKGNCECLRGAEEAAPIGPGTHVQIRINWCGYVYLDWSDQISIQRQTQPRETILLETFAKHVAKKTLKFMEIAKNNDNDNDQPERYLIGHGHIVPDDVILIGAVQVSHGSWMPILQLNSGYARWLGI